MSLMNVGRVDGKHDQQKVSVVNAPEHPFGKCARAIGMSLIIRDPFRGMKNHPFVLCIFFSKPLFACGNSRF